MAVAPLIGETTLGERAGCEFAGGGAFLAISPVESFRSGLASGLSESETMGPLSLKMVRSARRWRLDLPVVH
jgi:hypothetical protein